MLVPQLLLLWGSPTLVPKLWFPNWSPPPLWFPNFFFLSQHSLFIVVCVVTLQPTTKHGEHFFADHTIASNKKVCSTAACRHSHNSPQQHDPTDPPVIDYVFAALADHFKKYHHIYAMLCCGSVIIVSLWSSVGLKDLACSAETRCYQQLTTTVQRRCFLWHWIRLTLVATTQQKLHCCSGSSHSPKSWWCPHHHAWWPNNHNASWPRPLDRFIMPH